MLEAGLGWAGFEISGASGVEALVVHTWYILCVPRQTTDNKIRFLDS